MKVLVTGSAGLIGSEAVEFFDRLGFAVARHRQQHAGRLLRPRRRHDLEPPAPRGDLPPLHAPRRRHPRPGRRSTRSCGPGRYELVIHAAAQPSHDLAASRPFDDFDVNAVGTLNLLEATRRHAPEAVFITVTHQQGLRRRPEPRAARRARDALGLRRPAPTPRASTRRCRSTTAPTRSSARPRWRPTCSPRSTAATSACAPAASAAAASPARTTPASSCTASSTTSCTPRSREGPYTIFGYKGKQVRDQIHSADVISAFWAFAQDPRPGRGLQPRRRQGQRRQPARVRRADRRGVRRQAARAHLRRAGPGRRPHLLLLGHGQVPGALPRLAPGARPSPAIVEEMVAAVVGASSTDGAPRVRLTLVNQFYAPDISPTAQLAASLAEHRAEQGDRVTVVTGRAGYLEGLAPAAGVRHGARPADPAGVDAGPGQVVARSVACSATLTFSLGSVVAAGPPPPPGRGRRDDDPAVRRGRGPGPPAAPPRAPASCCGAWTATPTWPSASASCSPAASSAVSCGRSTGGRSAGSRSSSASTPRWSSSSSSQYARGAGPAALRGDPQLGAPVPLPRRRGRAPPWPGYDDLAVGDRTVVLYLGNTGVGPPVRHRAGGGRAA